MVDRQSLEALRVSEERQILHEDESSDGLPEEDDSVGCGEEEEKEQRELRQLGELASSQAAEESREEDSSLGVAKVATSSVVVSEGDQCNGLQVNSGSGNRLEAEVKEPVGGSNQDATGSVKAQGLEVQTENHHKSSVCQTFLSELSPTSVTQSISSAPSPTLTEKILSPPKIDNPSMPGVNHGPSDPKSLTVVPPARTHSPDGYNWRKYGQKQVKSPSGSRSYYKCTFSDCCAKKIECSDHSGHVIDIVNKGFHSHEPPRKNICGKGNKSSSPAAPCLTKNMTKQSIKTPEDTDSATLLKESPHETPSVPDRKRKDSIGSDRIEEIEIKGEHLREPEQKRRMKKGNLTCSGTILKSGKKPKFVVHAAGDVGISGDGYRWRKYGQKMVKGNPHPRNYYRCTSAGCPVRKHIETAVDNTSAVVITYKGVHDHDMPVPKKRHGPPSAPLVAATAPSSMTNVHLKKTDTLQSQVTPTQWSVGREGELTSETLELGGEKEKAIESARTLLSIGFEIKPC
ncbi:hypothetical protein K2173_015867 [Erythroxylum novogranatense]|uniref:WRKY domain-containing protein n=1 Tax=Erythroxylum novogranatense TaxID=1862640 RepID=A0AAV8SEM1_9ROSI|nr:hypothetical protein K2173_015867 [Erythroxylum novogranatense]